MYYRRKPNRVQALQYNNNYSAVLTFLSTINNAAYGRVPIKAIEVPGRTPYAYKSLTITVGANGAYSIYCNHGNFLVVDAQGFISVIGEKLFLDEYEAEGEKNEC